MREVGSLLWGNIDVECGGRDVCVKREDDSRACITNGRKNL